MSQALVDLNHWMGGDLSVNAVGDLASANGTLRGQQRVLRRLCTNPGSYMQQPNYGAGLGQFIGSTASVAAVQAVIAGQLALESAVAASPALVVNVTLSNTALAVSIQYTDAPTGQPVLLSFSVDPTSV